MDRKLVACGVVEFMAKPTKLDSNTNSATLVFAVRRADANSGNYMSAMTVLLQNQLQ